MQGHYDFPKPHWDKISPEAIDFVRRLLVTDGKQRMRPHEALDHK